MAAYDSCSWPQFVKIYASVKYLSYCMFCRHICPNEIIQVLKKMKNKKAVGPDDIPTETWKWGREGGSFLTNEIS